MRPVPQGRDGHLITLDDDLQEFPPLSTGISRHTWVDLDVGGITLQVTEWSDGFVVQLGTQRALATPAEMQRLLEQLSHLARATHVG
jgi:hypothetical protein